MLTRIEEAFKNMKSYLGLRPVYHQLEKRSDAHLFISVLAYHILHIIEHRLREKGDTRRWATIRDTLKTHQRITISFKEKDENGSTSLRTIRMNTVAEEEHREIYKKLGISIKDLPRNKTFHMQV